MNKFSSPPWMMASFVAGIFFVYSCGGGGGGGNVANADVATLEAKVVALEAKVADLEGWVGPTSADLAAAEALVATLEAKVADLQALVAAISDDGTTLTITGRNVQIISGSGTTSDGGVPIGLGNLIVGYNADAAGVIGRSGSHNLIIGDGHSYTSFGGFVVGFENTITGPYATVSGGFRNTASGSYNTVSGGGECESGPGSSRLWRMGGATGPGIKNGGCVETNDGT